MRSEWSERKRPVRLEGRYEFDGYDSLRDFLDAAADLSEEKNFYPDMGFGKDYVNITIHCEEGNDDLTDEQREFAKALDALFT